MNYDLTTLKGIVIDAAREELLPRFTKVEREQKADGSVITEADLACQQRIAEQLQQHWPETVFLGEEMSATQQAKLLQSEHPIWCLDPIDGTSNFAAGIPYFCVSLALIENAQVVLGIVYDPMRDEIFTADQKQGASLNAKPLPRIHPGVSLKQATAIVDFKRLSPTLAGRLIEDTPYSSQRSFGSVALDWCWLALGRGHVYLHGRSNIWDYAAGQFIFSQIGGHSCTLDGEVIFTNTLSARSSVAALDAELFEQWTQWIGIDLE
jgi:myo-inositol-1(or 4)-monophosphatase